MPPSSFALLLAGADGQAEAQRPVTATLTGLPRDVACAASSPATKPVVSLTIAAGRETAQEAVRSRGRGDHQRRHRAGGHAPATSSSCAGSWTTTSRRRSWVRSRRSASTPRACSASSRRRPTSSIAIVTYGCDGIGQGDYLERFEAPVMPPGTPAGTPDFARPGRLILGDDRRQIGGAGEFMVIDRGSDHGLRPGQRITIFRQTLPDGSGPVSTVGVGYGVCGSGGNGRGPDRSDERRGVSRRPRRHSPLNAGGAVASHQDVVEAAVVVDR